MISDINDVYQKVADKHGIDVRLVKSIGTQVFSTMKERMMNNDERHVIFVYEV